MNRVLNFNPGPATLPLAALEEAQKELLDYQGTGMSIMEHSHRGKAYEAVHNEAIELLRSLLSIPEDYHVLFLQGGATSQFAWVPLNFLKPDLCADYIITGSWSEKALKEASILGDARVAASTKESKFTRIPDPSEVKLADNSAYVHITSNNTIAGTQFHTFPETKSPLVADMSSDILSRRLEVSRFGLIYAGAQKNLGPSGVTVVIIKKSLMESGRTDIPNIFTYSAHAKANSLLNTAPTFPIYMLRNVMRWVKAEGGLDAIAERNQRKAKLVYETIDSYQEFYSTPVDKSSRSLMNIVFRLKTEELEAQFLKEAQESGMFGLKGHRSVGGIRASIYNAMSETGVQTLVDFMNAFARREG